MTDNERIQYKFMIPAPLKKRLEDAAHDNRRSLSAEIIARLDVSFAVEGEQSHDLIKDVVADVFERLVEIGALDPNKLTREQDPRHIADDKTS